VSARQPGSGILRLAGGRGCFDGGSQHCRGPPWPAGGRGGLGRHEPAGPRYQWWPVLSRAAGPGVPGKLTRPHMAAVPAACGTSCHGETVTA